MDNTGSERTTPQGSLGALHQPRWEGRLLGQQATAETTEVVNAWHG